MFGRPLWEMAEGANDVKARLVAEESQDTHVEGGLVGTSGCVSFRSSRLQVIYLGALKRRSFWGLGIKDSFLGADGT